MHTPALNNEKDPYEVKCHIRAQCAPPSLLNEEVVKDPKLRYKGWKSTEMELIYAENGVWFSKTKKLKIWKYDETEILPWLQKNS